MNFKKLVGMVLTILLGSALLVAVTPPADAQAANASLFNPGNIISDAQFFDGQAMNANEVQSFLSARVSTCRSGYTCLKDYQQATPNKAAVAGRCAAYSGAGSESAAQIIARVGAACGISQKALLVLLEKEQGIVSDTWPTARQYRSATGYGCPDTADCDTNFYGFFNQVYAAALQFQYYAANPTRWNHVPGRVNAVRFHPNAACGSSSVFIQNQATAGLYNYTPYQPNASALGNLYGSGDACGSYGNRNFWRIFTDWFGTPLADTSLFRTQNNATVYLTSGKNKYAVPDMGMLNALYPMGTVGYVSQAYLDNFTSGPTLGRIIRSNAGKVYFFDVGAKLQFMTCEDVAAYGYPCGDSIVLTDAQINALRDGPTMSRVFLTTTGKRFLIEQGVKREVLDDQSLATVAHPSNSVTLFEGAIAYLAYGAPVVRDAAAVKNRETGALGLLTAGSVAPLSTELYSQSTIRTTFPAGSLDTASLGKLGVSSAVTGFMRDANGRQYIASSEGRLEVRAQEYSGVTFTTIPSTILAKLPVTASLVGPHFAKETNSPGLYLVKDGKKQRLLSWGPYEHYVRDQGVPDKIWTVPDGMLGSLPTGDNLAGVASGELVKSSSSPRVYLVDGTRLLGLPSFGISDGLGFGTDYQTVSDDIINSYVRSEWIDSVAVSCGSAFLVGIGGSAAPVLDAALVTALGLDHRALAAATCEAMPQTAEPMTYFLRDDNGKIFWVDSGTKRPINSWEELVRLGGVDNWVQVGAELLAEIPTGSPTAA
ncbi:hypothetical protein D6T64_13145 [Cryobacterium melibiosiphilum]|uniref:Hemagglutinin n=1 Tax=Cryobacterium melibiosiphilum TaxID=995039 RepID=A0A3A5MG40_9MICO|nr:hypothetical protein [Cryobacterium melibiosiphilum]RJT87801.1 hypothetical protein D6T64_13145 [Cryobacterium melibiosiphilum]